MNIKEIKRQRERMGELATEARAELDKITDAMDVGQVKEIEARFDAMMSDHDKIAARVEREEKLLELEQRGMPSAPIGAPVEGALHQDEAPPEYRTVFEKAIRFGASALDAGERSVLMAHRTDIPEEVRAQSVGTTTAGGYTVPEGFSGELDKALAAWGPMWDAGIVRELTTSTGNALPWPTVDDTTKTGAIKSENAAVTDDAGNDVVFGVKTLNAYIYDTEMVRIPIELLQDSAFNMEALLNDLFSERLGRTANAVLTTGTGSSQPNGIVTASSLGKTATGAAAITADEIIDLLHSVDPAYRASPKCRFMFNDSTMAAIRKLKDGQGNYLWQMGDVRNGEPSMILGHPYSVNQAMASIATGNKTVLFGDFGRYIVRKVAGFTVMTLRERYAESFQVGMVGFKRFDGELLNSGAVKHLIQA